MSTIVSDVSRIATRAARAASLYLDQPSRQSAQAARVEAVATIGQIADLDVDLQGFDALDGADDYNAVDKIKAACFVAEARTATSNLRVQMLALRKAADAMNVGTAPKRRHVVVGGDTLERLAARYYGDFTLWPRIAQANRLSFTDDLTPGASLDIPDTAR